MQLISEKFLHNHADVPDLITYPNMTVPSMRLSICVQGSVCVCVCACFFPFLLAGLGESCLWLRVELYVTLLTYMSHKT